MRISKKIMLSMLITGCTSFAAFAMEDTGTKAEGAEEVANLESLFGLPAFESNQILQKIVGLDLNAYSGIKKAIGRLCQLRRVNKTFKNYLTTQKIAEILKKQGLNPNAIDKDVKDKDGLPVHDDTMLVRAIDDKNLEIVKVLISAGVDVNATYRDIIRMIPLDKAVDSGNRDIVEAIINAPGFDPKANNNQAEEAFRTAIVQKMGAIAALIAHKCLTKEEVIKIRKQAEIHLRGSYVDRNTIIRPDGMVDFK